jgi:hypothetical protein
MLRLDDRVALVTERGSRGDTLPSGADWRKLLKEVRR